MSQDLKFSLSKFKAVVKYKKFLEDKEKVEFKKVNDLFLQEKEVFEFLKKDLERALSEETSGIHSVAIYQIKDAYLSGLKKKIEKQTYILQRIERFLDKKKKDLQNAHIETSRSEKIIEKKTKDLEELLKKKEWDEVDELFLLRERRK